MSPGIINKGDMLDGACRPASSTLTTSIFLIVALLDDATRHAPSTMSPLHDQERCLAFSRRATGST
jgi:hypothetical protein